MSPAEIAGTRERLIEAARDLFWSQGYHATGVAQILQAAGARSGSLYHFFPTKEDLLLAVLEWYKAGLYREVIDPVFDRVTDPIERVFGVLDGYRQMLLMTEFSSGCPIGNLALELSDSHPAARELIADNFRGWRDAIRRSLDDALGRLPEGIDPERLATFVLTTMEGGVMLARSYKSMEPFEAAVQQLRDYFDRLLADGSSWSAPRSQTSRRPST
jgi:AcrR family transcriptional regulator